MSLSVRKPAGIRLEGKKESSLLNWNLKRPLPPEKANIPVPASSCPCVHPGDEVRIGQKVAEFTNEEGVNVFSGVAGIVDKIEPVPAAWGIGGRCIEVRRRGEFKPSLGTGLVALQAGIPKDWERTPPERLPQAFRDLGVVTTDPKTEPVHAKLRRLAGARTIIINGCEPEPYVTSEQVLIMAHPVEILKGAELLRKAADAQKIVFVTEDSGRETAELLKSKIFFLRWDHAEVRTVPALYPQGLESTLLQAWFPGQENEAIVFPASTAFAAYEAVASGKPFYERVVTVGGECVVEPRSLWLPMGISFHDAIHACKGMMREPRKVLRGGPMTGAAQTSLEVPVTAGTAAILALPKEVAKDRAEEPCIRCALCVDYCPVSLSPATITLAAEHGEFQLAEAWGARHCIECGSCAYVCPSKRPMLERLRLARSGGKRETVYG